MLAGGFDDGDEVTCVVTPFDGVDDGASAVAAVIVGAHDVPPPVNAPPSLLGVTITPATPRVGDALTCAGVGFSDPEGAPDQTRFVWRRAGDVVGAGAVLGVPLTAGDVITCEGIPFDGAASGEARSTTVTVANTPPTLAAAAITPGAAYPGDLLTCAWTGFADADGDPDRTIVDWYVNGVHIAAVGALTLAPAAGSTVTCEATPWDGADLGDTVRASLKVRPLPAVAAVAITPASVSVATEGLTCAYDGLVVGDGLPDGSAIAWRVNGEPAGAGATLAGGAWARGDLVVCEVRPSDGERAGVPVEAQVVVGNAAPTVAAATIDPADPLPWEFLTCLASDLADADGDAVSAQIAWYVNGAFVAEGPQLGGSMAAPGDVVHCEATPWDGADAGAPAVAAGVVMRAAPTIAGASVLPVSPTAQDTLTCSWSGFAAPSGGVDATTVAWQVNDEPVGTGPTLAGAFAKGDRVTCLVTPFDGVREGTPRAVGLTIADAAPSVASVALAPATLYVDSAITCTWAGFSDPDGDADQSLRVWLVDGAPVAGGVTLGAPVAVGQLVTCEVTPFDGERVGPPRVESRVVANRPPVIDGVSITPSLLGLLSVATAVVDASDPDGEAVTLSYEWRLAGIPVGTGSSLNGALLFTIGALVEVSVTARDPWGASATASASTQVGNHAPAAPTVIATPGAPAVSATLKCDRQANATDEDGDGLTYETQWSVNGGPWGLIVVGDVVAPTYTRPGQTWLCRQRASDGLANSAWATSQAVTIAAPTVISSDATIESDETWVLHNDVRVVGAKVNVKKGATVDGAGFTIWLDTGAKLNVGEGGGGSTTVVNDLSVGGWTDEGDEVATGYELTVDITDWTGGSIHDSATSPKKLSITGSVVVDTVGPTRCYRPETACTITGNVMVRCAGMSFDVSSGAATVTTNAIADPRGPIEKLAGAAGNLTVQDNAFMGAGIHVSLPAGATGAFVAPQNWWESLDATAVGAKINDQLDDSASPAVVVWTPARSVSAPGTPDPGPWR
ncbi:MAG: hypothetical protein KC635_03675 [Myxococcales bacterium]|nr:hypothetical protein [Myxococcales bacterium]